LQRSTNGSPTMSDDRADRLIQGVAGIRSEVAVMAERVVTLIDDSKARDERESKLAERLRQAETTVALLQQRVLIYAGLAGGVGLAALGVALKAVLGA